MTTDEKKPGKQIGAQFFERLHPDIAPVNVLRIAVCDYLDAEHARRQQFEANVLERLAKLEAVAPTPTPKIQPHCECGEPIELRETVTPVECRCGRAHVISFGSESLLGQRYVITYFGANHGAAARPIPPDAGAGLDAIAHELLTKPLPIPVGIYAGDGHPALRRGEDAGRYEPTEDPE